MLAIDHNRGVVTLTDTLENEIDAHLGVTTETGRGVVLVTDMEFGATFALSPEQAETLATALHGLARLARRI